VQVHDAIGKPKAADAVAGDVPQDVFLGLQFDEGAGEGADDPGGVFGAAVACFGLAACGDVVEVEDAMLGSGVGGKTCCGPFELADLTMASGQLKDGERERVDAAFQHFAKGRLKPIVVFGRKDSRKGLRDLVARGPGSPAPEDIVGVPDGIALTEDDDAVGSLFDQGAEVGRTPRGAASVPETE
jgi:hypothetical protein